MPSLSLPTPQRAPAAPFVREALAAPAPPTALALVSDLRDVTRGRSNVQTTLSAIIPAGPSIVQSRPSLAEEHATASRTSQALAKIVNLKVAATSTSVLPAVHNGTSNYIKLNAATDPVTGKSTSERVIRMVERPVDPLEPAKFKFRAAPRGPGSPPAPVLHSPPRKASAQEQQEWTIPPSVSNWKNPRGFTISLDKRMAAAGEPEKLEVNDNFSKLAEALQKVEEVARQNVSARARLKQERLDKQKELENETLRIRAAEARRARGAAAREEAKPAASDDEQQEEPEDDEGRRERDRVRHELKREVERDLRLEAAGKRTRTMREQERDVSERVALGMPVARPQSLEAQFDARLFTQARTGIAAGHGNDDDDLAYTGALFKSVDEHIYRPSASVRAGDQSAAAVAKLEELKQSDKFQPAFKGSSEGTGAVKRAPGPVQFERAPAAQPPQDDPLADMALSSVQRRAQSVLDGLGTRPAATMTARASGGVEGRLLGARQEEDDDDPTGEYAATNPKSGSGKQPRREMRFARGGGA